MSQKERLIRCFKQGFRCYCLPHPRRMLSRFEGIEVSASRVAFPLFNFVYPTSEDSKLEEKSLRHALDFCAGLSVGCAYWHSSEAPFANETLVKKLGFQLAYTAADVVFDLASSKARKLPSDVKGTPPHIIECKGTSIASCVSINEKGFGFPPDVMALLDDVFYSNPQLGVRHFLASWEGVPAAAANMMPLPGEPDVMFFTGAATLPEFRGRGLFSSLMTTMGLVAKSEGFRWIISQADINTSGPIATAFGVEILSETRIYFWTPPQAHGVLKSPS